MTHITRRWDVAEHLETEEDMVAYLKAAVREGDDLLIEAVVGDIARAMGMAPTEGPRRPAGRS